jgi:hypothetical protein
LVTLWVFAATDGFLDGFDDNGDDDDVEFGEIV